MSKTENINSLLSAINESFENSTLLKLTLSNKRNKTDDLNNVFVKPVVIKGGNPAFLCLPAYNQRCN